VFNHLTKINKIVYNFIMVPEKKAEREGAFGSLTQEGTGLFVGGGLKTLCNAVISSV